jgi:hypothetical protein
MKTSFQLRQLNCSSGEKPRACLRSPGVWTANASATPDRLLALMLVNSDILGPDLFIKWSTLPIPHIPLLRGFVELSCAGFHDFAIEAIRDAIDLVRAFPKVKVHFASLNRLFPSSSIENQLH